MLPFLNRGNFYLILDMIAKFMMVIRLNAVCFMGHLNGQERQQKLAEDQRNLLQKHAQTKAQNLRYEDELARKRQQVTLFLCVLVDGIILLK